MPPAAADSPRRKREGRRGALSGPPASAAEACWRCSPGFRPSPPRRAVLAGPRDQGIGGTGASITPAESGRRSRHRGHRRHRHDPRFGSVVVNGLRIAYPPDVACASTARRDAGALRIGQVVRIVALDSGGHYSTQAINVTSEAVGRVETARAMR